MESLSAVDLKVRTAICVADQRDVGNEFHLFESPSGCLHSAFVLLVSREHIRATFELCTALLMSLNVPTFQFQIRDSVFAFFLSLTG